MADALSMSIGPTGQPPVTTYTYDAGQVTLSARAAVAYHFRDLISIVARIGVFASAAQIGQTPPFSQPNTPLRYRYDIDNATPTQVDAHFRVGNLNLTATIDLAAGIVSFAERPERTIAWSDFELFHSWLQMLLHLARRPG